MHVFFGFFGVSSSESQRGHVRLMTGSQGFISQVPAESSSMFEKSSWSWSSQPSRTPSPSVSGSSQSGATVPGKDGSHGWKSAERNS